MEIITVEHSEYVPRQQLLRSAAESPDIKLSPNTSKASGKRAQQQRQKNQHAQDQPVPKPVPSSMVTEYGMTQGAQVYLEVSILQSSSHRSMSSPTLPFQLAETLSIMANLFSFAQNHEHLSASDALAQYCASIQHQQHQQHQQLLQQHQQQQHQQQQQQHQQHQQQQQQHHHQQQQQQLQQQSQHPQFNPQIHHQGQQQHNLNPQFQPPTHFLSPAQAAHLNLPGQNNTNATASPATLSNHPTPSMQNLALQNSMGGPTSVGMAHQASHQGTNPSNAGTPAGGSATASPNVTGKRRRPSGAQGKEMGEDVMEVNGVGAAGVQLGAKVKASPNARGKRQKGNG